MLKRQESSLSSSRRQAAAGVTTTPPPSEIHHAKSIGCMSGIIQLFSKYQNPNKRLTLGRKHEKLKPLSPTKAKSSSITVTVAAKNSPPAAKEDKIEKQNFDTKRLTRGIKVPRSPTLPPEIRRSNASRTPSSSLVARLMGLEDLGAKKAAVEVDHHMSEKRQRLLQALEKCNEDLEALKRIIKAVQSTADVRNIQPPRPGGGGNACIKNCTDAVADQEPNIPAGGVEELTLSPLSSISMVQISSTAGTLMSIVPQQRKPPAAKKPGEDYEPIAKLLNKSTITESSLHVRRPSCSRAMVRSVEEVCGDIAWGEKREIGRIGIVLQDHLWRELIDELVKELKSSCSIQYSLPLEACKRRLCF